MNGQRVTIRSVILNIGDIVTLEPKVLENPHFLNSKNSPRLALPDFLNCEISDAQASGTLTDLPTSRHVPFAFDPGLFTSYYSLRG